MAERSWFKRVGYRVMQRIFQIGSILLFSVRSRGRENIPADGGGLVCSNHQSFFDPVVVGIGFNRRMNYLARKSLFNSPLFGWIITFLDAIPIDRDGGGLAGLKETLKRLKRGEMVLIFPEGTRSKDGEIASLKPGFVALARRGKVPLIPVGIDGAYNAWPRKAKFPRRARIHVCIGEPMSVNLVKSLDDQELIAELERRIRECHATARAGRLS